jgi:NADH dehydrogenase/NADH:ubiquinone oxidoreductase subunit G
MKKIGLLIIATAFLLGSGFLKKNADGTTALDTSSLTKAAADATEQAETMTADAVAKAKKAAESITVKKEEILADLEKPLDEIKQKVAGMDTARLMAYASKYTEVFSDSQDKIAEYTAQLKDLKWTQKLGAKGKEIKGQLASYTDQFAGLKEHATLYLDKLKATGIDPAAYGIDLSAYGL